MFCGPNCPVTDIRVYPGLINQSIATHPYYTGGQYFIRPEWKQNRKSSWDLALIRLNTALPLDGTSGKTGINAICLPQKMALNDNEEYALLNGFGNDNNNGTGFGIQRMGWTKIMKATYTDIYISVLDDYALYAKRIPSLSGSAPCSGDSGSPYVQYVNGLAVVIGIQSGIFRVLGEDCPDVDSPLYAARVSYHIQWIIKTINDNN
ncbi:unnamed protein product [Medioppia subpectinata]|uniref:Peptidase S1 domain-containing protein n=1 Tax=Medioppia subpectinata TaxID=1979941 RepID=A0A7R9PYG8_9ACAR|nr:unnamed protein product [Medioppia subpectinata]CAG2105396.1 unnamed protein product [Medioppia subpectinata]